MTNVLRDTCSLFCVTATASSQTTTQLKNNSFVTVKQFEESLQLYNEKTKGSVE